MRTIGISAAVLTLTVATMASAKTLQAGAARTLKTPCAAIAAAAMNDTVEVDPGTYTDSCEINVAGLTVKGVGTMPKIDLSGTDHPADYKGIFVINAANITLENLELSGANISDDNGANGAGIRIQGGGLTVKGCFIHDNQDGILGGAAGTLTIENTEFANNGKGDGCNQGGCTHNLYISNDVDKLVFQYNWSHDIATDTADKGHLFKSRAKANFILYNRITGQMGHESYCVDLPNGGLAVVVGNLIEQGPNPDNFTLLTWGEEGASNADKRVFLANNTFVNDASKGTFVSIAGGGMLTAHNNLFVGPGTVSSTGALSADNLSNIDPLFMDRAGFDYRLKMGSPAIDKGVDPGKADTFDLTPTREYAQPTNSVGRPSDGKLDVGAYEFGAPTEGSGGGGTASGTSAGGADGAGGGTHAGGGSTSSASPTGAGGGTTSDDDAGDKGGCSCEATGGSSAPFASIGVVMLGLLAARRQRRTRSRNDGI